MSRPLRLEFSGALYHITARGNERKAIYADEADFEVFLEILDGVCLQHNWVIHDYCLMDNHYHLLLETPNGTLSKAMRQLNGVFTQAMNKNTTESVIYVKDVIKRYWWIKMHIY